MTIILDRMIWLPYMESDVVDHEVIMPGGTVISNRLLVWGGLNPSGPKFVDNLFFLNTGRCSNQK